jgi:hypothetical protein
MVFNLDKNFLTVEGFDSKDNFVCAQIIPTRMILQCHTTKDKPLDKNALTPEEIECEINVGYECGSGQLRD